MILTFSGDEKLGVALRGLLVPRACPCFIFSEATFGVNMKILAKSGLLLLLLPGFVAAEPEALVPVPEIFITADKFEESIDNISRSVEVRTAEEVEHLQARSLTEAAQNVSGVRITEVGGPGAPGLNPIEIRGFATKGSQVMLNGMTLNDPSSVNGTFENFYSSLTVFDLQRTEFLKGAAGVLYGSDSQAGAINMILQDPEVGMRSAAQIETGSYNTLSTNALLNAGVEKGGLVLSGSHFDTEGIGKVRDFESTTASAYGEVELVRDAVTIKPLFRFIDSNSDIDNQPSATEDGQIIPNQATERNNSDVRSSMFALTAETSPMMFVEQTTNVYFLRNDRDFFFDFDGFISTSEFQGDSFNADHQTTFAVDALKSKLSVGVDYEHQQVDNNSGGVLDKAQRDQTALYVYNKTGLMDELLQIGAGARVSTISDISKTIAKLETSASYLFPESDTKLHSSIAQGYRAPTLFESKGNLLDYTTGEVVKVGNQNLDEEESLSWDFGVEQGLFDEMFVFDTTFFQIDADETIIFDYPGQTHLNGGGGKTQGIENALLFKPVDNFYLRGSYTHLDSAEGLEGARRQRTPRNWYALTAVGQLGAFTASGELRYRDTQNLEFFGVPTAVEEDDVTVFDVAVTYTATPYLKLFVRGDNIFDVDYTEAGYLMPRATVFGGVKVELG